MRSRSTLALSCATVVWLCLVAALFVPALLMRDRVPGGLNYLTLLFLPGVVPAVAGAAVYARTIRTGQQRSDIPRWSPLFAFTAALAATAAILAVQNAMDKDRSGGRALFGFFLLELFTIGLGNAIVAAAGAHLVRRLQERRSRIGHARA